VLNGAKLSTELELSTVFVCDFHGLWGISGVFTGDFHRYSSFQHPLKTLSIIHSFILHTLTVYFDYYGDLA
jgi:hypothetical protein